MKINQQPPIQAASVGSASGPTGPSRGQPIDASTADPSAAGRASGPAAKVELSARSRELHEALRAAHATPDVRSDVVAEIRKRIDNGTYRVDPDKIARRILDTNA